MDEVKRARSRAAEFRAIAETFSDERARNVVLMAAEELERIATARERRLATASAPSNRQKT